MKFILLNAVICLFLCVQADTISRRQNFFRTVGNNAISAKAYLADKDPEIRRYALYLVLKNAKSCPFEVLEKAAADPDENVRLTLVSALPQKIRQDKRITPLLQKIAKHDNSPMIRKIAVRSTWPFYREIKLLRNDPTWDYEVKTIKSIPLQNLPWLMVADPMQEGHLKGFFKSSFNTSKWKNIKMGVWENQGLPDYDGVVWYQIKFKMPPKMDCNAVEIAFDGVDESAWVWLNGIYLGCHDIGPEGWKEPFSVDCRKEIRWGEENVLTVRVYDSAFAGGIYKPVRVDILK